MAWYLYQQDILILCPLHLGDDYRLHLSSPQNSSVLLALPLLLAWSLYLGLLTGYWPISILLNKYKKQIFTG